MILLSSSKTVLGRRLEQKGSLLATRTTASWMHCRTQIDKAVPPTTGGAVYLSSHLRLGENKDLCAQSTLDVTGETQRLLPRDSQSDGGYRAPK